MFLTDVPTALLHDATAPRTAGADVLHTDRCTRVVLQGRHRAPKNRLDLLVDIPTSLTVLQPSRQVRMLVGVTGPEQCLGYRHDAVAAPAGVSR